MKSPICYLCHKDFRSEYFHTGAGGDLVRFADFKPPPEDAGGQPRGMEWFCTEHLSAAQELAHLSSAAALSHLQARFGEFPAWQEKPLADPSLWVTAESGRIHRESLPCCDGLYPSRRPRPRNESRKEHSRA